MSQHPVRQLLGALACAAALAACSSSSAPPPVAASSAADAPSSPSDDAERALARLEQETGARVGLLAVDTATGRVVEHRADERFAFASTSKALSAAAVLAATDDAALDAAVAAEDGTGTTLREAAAAAVLVSDNDAQNLLLSHLGGPQGLGAALRALGDTTTQPERYEPDLNDVAPGEVSDTTTARAMTGSLRAYAVDGALDDDDRAQLLGWMRASTTGGELVRAGVPAGWDVADKSGTPSGYGGRNDVALVWPPGADPGRPWVLTVFTDRPQAGADAEPVPDLVARATAVAVEALRS